MNNRIHRDSEGAEKGIKDKEKGRIGDLLCRLGEADRLCQMKHLWPKMVIEVYKNLFSG